MFEKKPPDLIKERVDNDYMSHLTAALTSVRGLNKTDVTTLASTYGVRLPLLKLTSYFHLGLMRITMVCSSLVIRPNHHSNPGIPTLLSRNGRKESQKIARSVCRELRPWQEAEE